MNTTSFISGAGFDRSNVASQPLLQGQLHVLVQLAAYLLEVVIITSNRSTIVLLHLQALSNKIGELCGTQERSVSCAGTARLILIQVFGGG